MSDILKWGFATVLMGGTKCPMAENCVDNSVLVETLASWQEFCQKIPTLTSKRGYVWRGQKKDEDNGWFLQSSFDREGKSKDRGDRKTRLEQHLANFKKEMDKHYPNVLPKDDIDIWALGQHYGLKTPLLDWSLSPYKAAYFAFIQWTPNDPTDRYRYIYALNRSVERLMSKTEKASEILRERAVFFIDQVTHVNPRFSAQEGILTKAFHGNKIEEYVKIFARKRPGEARLVKFRIPTQYRDEVLRELHQMGIDHTSLLLDFRDVVDRVNSRLGKR